MTIPADPTPCDNDHETTMSPLEWATCQALGLPLPSPEAEAAREAIMAGEVDGGSLEVALTSLACDARRIYKRWATDVARLGLLAKYDRAGNTEPNEVLLIQSYEILTELNALASDPDATFKSVRDDDVRGEARSLVRKRLRQIAEEDIDDMLKRVPADVARTAQVQFMAQNGIIDSLLRNWES